MAPYPTGSANCTNHGVLKYARRTIYPLQMPEGGHGGARGAPRADGGGDDAVVPTYCFEIKEVIGMRALRPSPTLSGSSGRSGAMGRGGDVAVLPHPRQVWRGPE